MANALLRPLSVATFATLAIYMLFAAMAPAAADKKKKPVPPAAAVQNSPLRSQQAQGSRVVLDLAPSFEPAPRFVGFWDEGRNISVVMSDMPAAAYDQLAQGFTPEALIKRGFLDPRAGSLKRDGDYVYFRAAQTSPAGLMQKYLLAIRAPDATALVSINVPTTSLTRGDVSDAEFEAILQSARIVAVAPPIDEIVSISDPGPLKLALTYGQTRIYTVDGKSGAPGSTAPSLLITTSMNYDSVEKPAAVAAAALTSLAGYKTMAIIGDPRVVTVAGYAAVEAMAKGEAETSGDVHAVYQVLIPQTTGGYVRLLGIAPLAEQDQWFFQFRKSAATLKIRD
jgi:hypothetical protein